MSATSINSKDWQAALKSSRMSLVPSFQSAEAKLADGHKERFDKLVRASSKAKKYPWP